MKKVISIAILLLLLTGCKTLTSVKEDCRAAGADGSDISTTCKLILAVGGD